MAWYWVAIIVLGIHSAIGTVVAIWGKDEWLDYWAIGIVGLILFVLLYPIRAWRTYSDSYKYYQRHNISRLQYLLGKRVKYKYEEEDDE